MSTGFASDRALDIEERMISTANQSHWRIKRADRIGAPGLLQGSQSSSRDRLRTAQD
jgi:hypothetical protein